MSLPLRRPRKDIPSCGISAEAFIEVAQPISPATHTHQMVELTYLAVGSMRNTIDGDTLILAPGDLAVTGLGANHLLEFERATYYNLYLDVDRFPLTLIPPDFVDELLPILAPPSLRPSFGRRSRVIRCIDPDRVTDCFQRMSEEREHEKPGWESALLHWGALILTECGRALRVSAASSRGRIPQDPAGAWRLENAWSAVDAVRRDLDGAFRERLSMDRLSALSGYEPHYLSVKFKAFTGRTITDYLNDRRVRQAMHLLRTTNHRVLDIALACGFEDAGYFGRCFKRRTGTTPREYRGKR